MLTKLFRLRLWRRPRSIGDVQRGRGTAGLAALIQALAAMEKAAEMINIPCLKGAVGLALIIAESVRVSDPAGSVRCNPDKL
jgi:hypothetical protein